MDDALVKQDAYVRSLSQRFKDFNRLDDKWPLHEIQTFDDQTSEQPLVEHNEPEKSNAHYEKIVDQEIHVLSYSLC